MVGGIDNNQVKGAAEDKMVAGGGNGESKGGSGGNGNSDNGSGGNWAVIATETATVVAMVFVVWIFYGVFSFLGGKAAVQWAVLLGRGMHSWAVTSNNQQKVRESGGGQAADALACTCSPGHGSDVSHCGDINHGSGSNSNSDNGGINGDRNGGSGGDGNSNGSSGSDGNSDGGSGSNGDSNSNGGSGSNGNSNGGSGGNGDSDGNSNGGSGNTGDSNGNHDGGNNGGGGNKYNGSNSDGGGHRQRST
jgi:collagen type III alpha